MKKGYIGHMKKGSCDCKDGSLSVQVSNLQLSHSQIVSDNSFYYRKSLIFVFQKIFTSTDKYFILGVKLNTGKNLHEVLRIS